MTSIDAAPAPPPRLPWIDAARGVAIAAMVVYHFSWDLRYFGFISADVAGGLGWQMFARAIAGTFLALVGISLVLADRRGFDARRYLRRLAMIAGGALAVTVATYFATPQSYVFFGILHAIALSSVLSLAFVRAPLSLVIAAAVVCFALPALVAHPFFDAPRLLWLGLGTHFPQSNDYVPIFPWFGVVLGGIAAARLALSSRLPAALRRDAPRQLVWAGRHSLAIYLLHQPILFGIVYLAALLAPPTSTAFEAEFLQSCTAFCTESDLDVAACRRICACVASRSKSEGLWESLARQALGEAERARYVELAGECRAAMDEVR